MPTVVDTMGRDERASDPLFNTGKIERTVKCHYKKAAKSEAANVVLLAAGLPIDIQVTGIVFPFGMDAVSGINDIDIGVHRDRGETVIDADCLVDGLTISGASIDPGESILGYGIGAFDHEAQLKDLLDLETDEAIHRGVDICMTINTSGTNAAEFNFDLKYVTPGSF